MAQLQSPIVLGGLLPSFTPQMRTNVHGMLVPISRAWPVYLSWASTDKFIQFVDTQMCNRVVHGSPTWSQLGLQLGSQLGSSWRPQVGPIWPSWDANRAPKHDLHPNFDPNLAPNLAFPLSIFCLPLSSERKKIDCYVGNPCT